MDRISNSIKNKNFVFWEEIARDGAQAKTILSAEQRAEIANEHSTIFGKNSPDHLVFAAGFVSVGKEEKEIIKKLADLVENCYLAVNCRSAREEIDDSIDAIKNAKYPRIAYVFPGSERLCRLMLHKTQKEALNQGIEIAKYAKDKAGNIPVDVQIAASFDADPKFIAEAASALKEQGIAIVHLGDTRGRIYPQETADYMTELIKNSDSDQLYGLHFHNDLGFSLANNFEGIKQGVTLAASSWLGLAERNGIVSTELLTFLLSYEPENIAKRLGFDGRNLFLSPPELKLLKPIAEKVSKYTGIELKVTDPIVGTGVNTISTGTPFVDTVSFQPFDSHDVLGINKKIYVTQLASKRVIKEVGLELGFSLSDEKIEILLEKVKEIAYKKNRSIFPQNELIELFTNA